MRISLLLQREPFGRIFEETLENFLQQSIAQPFTVRWVNGRRATREFPSGSEQMWLCNSYLNAIFVHTAEEKVFEPVYREFSRARHWWKRSLQRLYVGAAIHPTSRKYLAHASVSVFPPIPDAENRLFVGGNHKIRLLDATAKNSYGILKAGFPHQHMEREITTRTFAERLGLPVPNLKDIASDRSWFCEEYITGTPLNRLASKAEQKEGTAKAFAFLERLWQSTAEEVNVVEYANQLSEQVQQTANGIALLDNLQRQNIQHICKRLLRLIETLSPQQPQLPIVLTHGDWQPANILVEGYKIWLIDWEYSDRRMAGYDELVFVLQSRMPIGLAKRLGDWTKFQTAFHFPEVTWSTDISSVTTRELMASLFLLEELSLHTIENTNRRFTQLGKTLETIQNEAEIWLQMVETVA